MVTYYTVLLRVFELDRIVAGEWFTKRLISIKNFDINLVYLHREEKNSLKSTKTGMRPK